MDEALSAAWEAVAADWENVARHDALRTLAIEHDQLRWLATRYRDRKGDAIADAQLAKIASAAMATMLSREAAARDAARDHAAPYRRALVWMLLLVIMLLLGLLAAKVVTGGHHPGPQ